MDDLTGQMDKTLREFDSPVKNMNITGISQIEHVQDEDEDDDDNLSDYEDTSQAKKDAENRHGSDIEGN
jgi:predicted RNA-binding protein with PUA-like domain